jgi:hypothetical protein
MAAGTYPMVAGDDPVEFVRRLSTAEIALGALLLGRYLTTPGMRKPGSLGYFTAGVVDPPVTR